MALVPQPYQEPRSVAATMGTGETHRDHNHDTTGVRYIIETVPNANPFGDMTENDSIRTKNFENRGSENSGGLLKEVTKIEQHQSRTSYTIKKRIDYHKSRSSI